MTMRYIDGFLSSIQPYLAQASLIGVEIGSFGVQLAWQNPQLSFPPLPAGLAL